MWREYAAATFEQIEVNTRLKLRAWSLDDGAIGILRLQVEVAATRRAAAQDALREHEYGAHRDTQVIEEPAN